MKISLPAAFSVRDEHEIHAHRHLLSRLNPKMIVHLCGMGLHVNGGSTVYWCIVYEDGKKFTRDEYENALCAAGFDLEHNGRFHRLNMDIVDG